MLKSTGAMAVLEDDEDIIRTMPFPIGSYYRANSPRGSADTCFRKVLYDCSSACSGVQANNVSESVKACGKAAPTEKWIELMHLVCPEH